MYNVLKPIEENVQLIYDISNIKINLRETKIFYIIDIEYIGINQEYLNKHCKLGKLIPICE